MKYHEEMISKLQEQFKRIGERVDAMYLDKLDGRITSEFFDSKSGEWRNEQDKILRQIEAHKKADQSYMEKGIQLLELAQRSVILYEKQEMREKRKILNFVVSNSIWKDGKLSVNFRKPFDLLAVTKQKSQEVNPGSSCENSNFENWMGYLDSNQGMIESKSIALPTWLYPN